MYRVKRNYHGKNLGLKIKCINLDSKIKKYRQNKNNFLNEKIRS